MMKAMLLKNPISTRQDFAAGGSGLPILTRNPTQSTAGFQTFGLPTGKSYGGSANRTVLGAVRMGDQDGIAPGSAILPDDIFYPPGQADRKYTQVMFENVGNNVYQPDTVQRAAATEVLLRRLGDNQFKATDSAAFEDYFATQRLAREVDMASRNAGIEDLGHSREIMRSLVAERRKTDEDDFLRRMLDAGMTQQDAQDEIDNVRRANALQEARKVDDRTHQSKILIQRIAKSRGILSSVNEPLTTSGAIENPQPNERMADMTNQPENAYGSSPLDRDRQFMTPDFYRRMLRRSALTQEAGDEMSALANATAQSETPVPTPSMLRGLERQNAIERTRDNVASRLESVSGKRVSGKMPKIATPFSSILGEEKKPGSIVRFQEFPTQDLSSFQSILALNQIVNEEGSKLVELKRLLAPIRLTQTSRLGEVPVAHIKEILRKVTVDVIPFTTISLPVVSDKRVDDAAVYKALNGIKLLSGDEVKTMRRELAGYTPFDLAFSGAPADTPLPPPVDTRSLGRIAEDVSAAALRDALGELRAEFRAPGVRVETGAGRGSPAVGGGGGGAAPKTLSKMNQAELQAEARRLGLSDAGNKKELAARIRDAR